MEKIGVFIIDNNSVFREGLTQRFTQTEDIEVVGGSSIIVDAVELVVDFSPEIVVVDIGLPLLSGLNVGRQITRRSPGISMVVLTPYDDDEHLFQAIKSGAASYLTKDATVDELASAIRRIHQGERIINETVLTRPQVAERVLRQFQDLSLMGIAVETLTAPLTARELQILGYVARGYPNKQVANKLGISEQTIKNYMSSILRKLDANDRTQAVVMAMQHGWISARVGELSQPIATGEIKAGHHSIEQVT